MVISLKKIIPVQHREVCTKNIDEVIDGTSLFIRDKFDTCLLHRVTTKVTLNPVKVIIDADMESTCGDSSGT